MRRIERVKKVLRLSGLMLLGAAVGWIISQLYLLARLLWQVAGQS